MSESDKFRKATSVRQKLLKLSKERGEDFNLVLTRYALERFLHRLSVSEHREKWILKGAMLFQIWSQTRHRATGDMDFLARGETDEVIVSGMIHNICSIATEEDGIAFDLSNLKISEIRENSRYGGRRIQFLAMLGTARIPIQLDLGIGDAITPGPTEIEYPTLLDMASPKIFAYPRETVIAEKLEAIVELGFENSRMKDFFDLWFIFTTFEDEPALVAEAIAETFRRRRQTIPEVEPIGLSDEFAIDPAKQTQWNNFTKRTVGVAPTLPEVVCIIREHAEELFKLARERT